jgi:hypothetical protein
MNSRVALRKRRWNFVAHYNAGFCHLMKESPGLFIASSNPPQGDQSRQNRRREKVRARSLNPDTPGESLPAWRRQSVREGSFGLNL